MLGAGGGGSGCPSARRRRGTPFVATPKPPGFGYALTQATDWMELRARSHGPARSEWLSIRVTACIPSLPVPGGRGRVPGVPPVEGRASCDDLFRHRGRDSEFKG